MIAVKKNKFRQATHLFSNSFFQKIIDDRSSSILDKYISNYIEIDSNKKTSISYHDVIFGIYKEFENFYRNEYIYKNKLVNQLLIEKYKGKNTAVFTEFAVGKSIADLILINGSGVLYEIKTELDKTVRLDTQVSDYYKCFKKINIVTHQSLHRQYLKLAEQYKTGLIVYDSNHNLIEIKKPNSNLESLSHLELFKLLRKNEVISLLENEKIQCPIVPNTKFFKNYLAIVHQIDIEHFQNIVFQKIKLRKLGTSSQLLKEEIPIELKQILNCLDLKAQDSSYLFDLLNRNIRH